MTVTSAPPSGSAGFSDVRLGLTLMVLSVLISPLIDIFAKLAIAAMPASEITFARFLFQVVVLLPIVLYRGTLLDLT